MPTYYTEYGQKIRNPEAYASTGAPMYETKYGNTKDINAPTIIYKMNLQNDKKYIGKTTDFDRRMEQHFSGNGSKVTKKFKPISGEVIDEVPLSEWKFWENYWIEQFKSWGFNLKNKNNGGGGATKQNFSPQRSKKISKARLGKPMPHKGKPLSEEHKAKLKATRGFLKERENTWTAKPVLQYDLDGNFIKKWESAKIAAQVIKNKTNGSDIIACLKGRQKTAYSYKWKSK